MRRALALLLAAALLLGLWGCEAEPPVETAPSQPVEQSPTPSVEAAPFALAYDPAGSLHPITGAGQVNLDLAPLVYQGLYALDNSFVPQPVLAQSAASDESGLVWTVALREGVCFSDGTPLDAAHVAASLNTARNSTLYAARLASVASVTAGEGAVVITLSAPNGGLPALLDIPVALPREEGPPLGTGRYCYTEDGEGLCLAVNPFYAGWRDLPYQTIPLRPVTDADGRIAAFDSGEVTAVVTDLTSAYALGYAGSYETCDFPTTTMVYVGFRASGGPCQSALVRRAVSLALDRETAVGVTLAGHADPACLPVSPLSTEYAGWAGAALDYDLAGAAELLSQAGYTLNEEDGLLYQRRTPLALTLVVNSDSAAKQAIAGQLADSLTGLGVTVTVRRLAWQDYLNALAAGQFDLYLGEVQLTGDFDPAPLLTGALNYGGYDAAPLAELLDARQSAVGSQRVRAAASLWDAFAREAPFAPLCFKRGSLLVRWGMVTDLTPTRGDPYSGMEDWTVIS